MYCCKHVNGKKVVLYVLSIVACSIAVYMFIPKHEYLNELYNIERRLKDDTDHCVQKLKQMDSKKLSSKEFALYCLLLSKGRCINNSLSQSDSLINIAVGYYKNNFDSLRLSQSYFYKGKIFELKKYFLEAYEYYQKSKECIVERDYETNYILNYSMGNIYHSKMMNKEEKEVKKNAICYAILLNDSIKITDSYIEMAGCYNRVDVIDSSLVFLENALRFIPYSEKKLLSIANAKLAKISLVNNQFINALQYVNQAINVEKDSLILYDYYNLKAESYYNINQFDSAQCYFVNSLNANNVRVKMTACYGLSHLYEKQGDKNEAFTYLKYYIQYRDALDLSQKEERMDRLQSIQVYRTHKKSIKAAKIELNRKRIIIYRIIVVAVILVLVLLTLYYRIQKRKRRLEYKIKLEEEKRMRAVIMQKETEYKLLQEQEERKKVEVQQLNKTVEYYKRLNAMTIPILLKSQNNQGVMNLTQEEWEIIVKNTDACFDWFTQRLKQYCSLLTDEEVQFCCLVKMELSIILLSQIYHIAKGSISRKKMRLKEKLKIKDVSFDEFIQNF